MTQAPSIHPIDSLPLSSRLAGFVPWAGVEAILITLTALFTSLALFGVFVLLVAHKNPFDVFGLMYKGSFGTSFAWGNTLTRAAPLLLAGLCTALPARLGMVIIG